MKKEEEEIILKNNLQEVILDYVRNLKAKRWELECKLDKWEENFSSQKLLEYKETIIETRRVLDLIVFKEEDLVLNTLNLSSLLNERVMSSQTLKSTMLTHLLSH